MKLLKFYKTAAKEFVKQYNAIDWSLVYDEFPMTIYVEDTEDNTTFGCVKFCLWPEGSFCFDDAMQAEERYLMDAELITEMIREELNKQK